MTINFQDWAGAAKPSVYSNTLTPLRATEVTPRPSGALRYRCPINNSIVLVTDETTLAGLDRREGLLRCVGCGDTHLLTCDGDLDDEPESGLLPVRGIVGALAKL